MSTTALIIDTSYLVELLKVPGRFDPSFSASRDILYDLSELVRHCDLYAEKMAIQGIGLSDTSVIAEARRLKQKYNQPDDRVHIWTKDKNLKRHEPDAEPEPLM